MTNVPFPSIFEALKGRAMFVIYRRADKTPVHPSGLYNVNAQDAANWLVPEIAAPLAASYGPEYGVGLVLTPNCGIFCIDIDKSLIGGQWSPLAVELCNKFSGAYQEVSQSNAAIHIFASYKGTMPLHRKKNTALHLEMYDELRFVGVTGTNAIGDVTFDATALLPQFIAQYFQPGPDGDNADTWTTEPLWQAPGGVDDADLVAKACRSKSARAIFGDTVKFEHLWKADAAALAKQWPGNHDGYDASSADQSLANRLIWWTGGDCERTAKLMRESALNRDKYAREDYFQATILNALALVSKNPPKPKGSTETGAASDQGTERAKKPLPLAPTPTQEDPRAVLLLSGGKLDHYAVQAEQLLAESVYVRGDGLVRIGRAADISNALLLDPNGTKRDAMQAVMIKASGAWLRRELMARAQFWKFDKRSCEWEPKDCPKELADNIGDQASWSSFRHLVAITSAPFLRPEDMSVCAVPGYDSSTAIYYQPTVEFPSILAAPTRDDALHALNRLWEPFAEFPFSTPYSAAALLAHVITSVVRPSFGTCPIFVYNATIAATGKTLLASLPSLIATGVEPALSPYTEKEELRKVLFASLLAGDAALTLDNVPNGTKVRAPALALFATSSVYSDRVLGVSETRKLPNRCTVTLTGNNITPMSDLARRSLVVRLDVNAESARGRKFRIKHPRRFVVERRAQFIVDVLTIVRAYALAGRPEVAHPLESFEDWSAIARDPLIWLGVADAVATQQDETDDEVAPVEDVLAAIAGTIGVGKPFTAANLANTVLLAPGGALREALTTAGCAEPHNPMKVGYWLREYRGRVGGGFKLERSGGSKHKGTGTVWMVRPI
jgi:putative DNA primase/helicase